MTATTVIKNVTIGAGAGVGMLNALGLPASATISYQLLVWIPSESNLQLGDSGFATDPEAPYIPLPNPFRVDSVRMTTLATDDIFIINPGSVSQVVTAMAWIR